MNNLSVLLVLLCVVVFFGYSIYLDIKIYRKLHEHNAELLHNRSLHFERQVQDLQNELDKSQAEVKFLTDRVDSLKELVLYLRS